MMILHRSKIKKEIKTIDQRRKKKLTTFPFLKFNYHLFELIIHVLHDFFTITRYFSTYHLEYHLFSTEIIHVFSFCQFNINMLCHIIVYHPNSDKSFHLLVTFISTRGEKFENNLTVSKQNEMT